VGERREDYNTRPGSPKPVSPSGYSRSARVTSRPPARSAETL
jgi:hypothetical protein